MRVLPLKQLPMPYIIGCDIGTTNVKSVAFDTVSGTILASHSESYEMQHPRPDWSEQDPESWCRATEFAVGVVRARSPIAFAAIRAIGRSVFAQRAEARYREAFAGTVVGHSPVDRAQPDTALRFAPV